MQQAGLSGHVGKGSIAVVSVKRVFTPIGDKNVLESVVIQISNADAGGPAGSRQPRFGSDVRKRAVPVVLVEMVGCPGRRSLKTSPIQDEEIHPAIVVEVDEGAAAPDGLHDVVFVIGGTVDQGSGKAGFPRNVRKVGAKRYARRCGAGLWLHSTGSDLSSQPDRGERRRGRDKQRTAAKKLHC